MTIPEPRQLEMARAALDCEVVTDAFRLAEWLGSGRELTASGVLRPAVALQACQVLGIPLATGKLRSAKDVPRLQRAWESAAAADLVRITANRASAAPEAAALAAAVAQADSAVDAASFDSELAGQVVLAWLRAVGFQFGFPHDICAQCVSTLIELGQADGPTEVIEVVMALLGEDDGDLDPSGMYLCPDCGQLHETLLSSLDIAEGDEAEHVLDAIEVLTSFGAVATGPGHTPGGTVTLTLLGRLFAESTLTSISPLPSESAADLLDIIAGYPPRLGTAASACWAAARTPSDAARELLNVAAECDDALPRVAALTVARQLGPEALPAWRELAARPGFGAYAREYLAELGEDVPFDAKDQAWLLVDTVMGAMKEMPESLRTAAFRALVGDIPPEIHAAVEFCDHPKAASIAAMLAFKQATAAFSRGPGRRLASDPALSVQHKTDGKLYQLLIMLRYVDSPKVWRRVVVPARITLGELHGVIQEVMGWEDCHLHSFAAGKVTYGVPDGDFMSDDQDEDAVLLSDLLSRKAQKLTYTYDFGDDWEHVVKLEKILLPGSKEAVVVGAVPACLAGEGACPPEDCGGSWGYANLKEAIADPRHDQHEDMMEWLGLDDSREFNPAAFDLTEINDRLRG